MVAHSPSPAEPLYRPPARFDALRLPGLGWIARARNGRLVFQIPLLIVALLLIYDGFTGNPLAARNLATIAPWVHYRGLVVIALLLVGNLFCMGCPFTLPRTLARRLAGRGRRFPRVLRNKWLAIAGLFGLFFAYEWLDLWGSPALTAWVIIAYFVASFVLELWFAESPFCKYICPLGSFNFVYSTAAPLQIQAKNHDVCRTCVGKECVNGSYSPTPMILIDQIGGDGQPTATHTHDKHGVLGCGTLLFPPTMGSSMDCTLCLDCVRACPHDNIGLLGRTPGAEWTRSNALPARWDIGFLLVALAFLGLINAFGMVPPVYDLMQSMADTLGLRALGLSDLTIEGIALGVIFVVGGLIIPAALTLSAAGLSRAITNTARRDSLRVTFARFAPAFIPIGLGFWAAHYGYHLLIGLFSIVPAFQAFLLDHGIGVLGAPNWTLAGVTDLAVVGATQAVALIAGFAASLSVTQRIAGRAYGKAAWAGALPYALLLLAMMAFGMWLFSLPMEMRGTVLFD